MTTKVANLPTAIIPWMDSSGRPTQAFRQFMTLFAAGNLGPFPSAVTDADAAKTGVDVGGVYQNAGALRVRLV